jgi:hypothetical protein
MIRRALSVTVRRTSSREGTVHETLRGTSPGSKGWRKNWVAPPSPLAEWQRAQSSSSTSVFRSRVPGVENSSSPRSMESARKSLSIFSWRVGSRSQ